MTPRERKVGALARRYGMRVRQSSKQARYWLVRDGRLVSPARGVGLDALYVLVAYPSNHPLYLRAAAGNEVILSDDEWGGCPTN